METFQRWLNQWTSSESGSLILFLLVFLTRVAIDRWQRNQDRKRSERKKKVASG